MFHTSFKAACLLVCVAGPARGQRPGSTLTKVASVGGQQVLDCERRHPTDQSMQFILYWRKDGIKDPILIKYDGYSAQVGHWLAVLSSCLVLWRLHGDTVVSCWDSVLVLGQCPCVVSS